MALGGQIQCKSPNRRVFPLFTPRDADKMFGEVRVELEDLGRFAMALGFDIRVQRNRRIAERRPHVRGTPGPHAARILASRRGRNAVRSRPSRDCGRNPEGLADWFDPPKGSSCRTPRRSSGPRDWSARG